jgi:hypothetical protein
VKTEHLDNIRRQLTLAAEHTKTWRDKMRRNQILLALEEGLPDRAMSWAASLFSGKRGISRVERGLVKRLCAAIDEAAEAETQENELNTPKNK